MGSGRRRDGIAGCIVGGGLVNSWTIDASTVARHKGHSLFCAWRLDAKHCKWNLWLQDNVKSGEPGASALRQNEHSSVVFDDIALEEINNII